MVAFVVAAVLGFGPASASPAFAPSQDLEIDEGFDGNETEDHRPSAQLLGVAAITGALLVVYIRTDPAAVGGLLSAVVTAASGCAAGIRR